MIGLDTNVVVRYLIQDDAEQSLKASRLIESLTHHNPGFLTTVSVIELVWVLQSCYRTSKNEIIAWLEVLLHTQELVIENASVVRQALRRFSASCADFADCLIERTAHTAGCAQVVSFDTNAIKSVGMQPVPTP